MKEQYESTRTRILPLQQYGDKVVCCDVQRNYMRCLMTAVLYNNEVDEIRARDLPARVFDGYRLN
jgi:hypothetical protein